MTTTTNIRRVRIPSREERQWRAISTPRKLLLRHIHPVVVNREERLRLKRMKRRQERFVQLVAAVDPILKQSPDCWDLLISIIECKLALEGLS